MTAGPDGHYARRYGISTRSRILRDLQVGAAMPMIVLYLHAVHDDLFQRREFVPLPPKQPERLYLALLGPVVVKAYKVA